MCDRRTDGQADRQTHGRTENTIHKAAWSQLKSIIQIFGIKQLELELEDEYLITTSRPQGVGFSKFTHIQATGKLKLLAK